MTRLEKSMARWLQENIMELTVTFVVVASLAVRVLFFPFHTWDLDGFLLPWVAELKEGGIALLGRGVGNYNIIYVLFLSLVAKLPGEPMYWIKALSVLFDYLLALGAGMVVFELRQGQPRGRRMRWAMVAFTATTILPPVLINSALWGQCDSIHSALCLFAVYCLLRQRYLPSFLWLSLAFCVKMQTIFVLPLFVIVYFASRRFTAFLFLLLPAMLFVSTLPAIFFGASPLVGFEIYRGQAGAYPEVYISYPGLAGLIRRGEFDIFGVPMVFFALITCLLMLAWVLRNKVKIEGEGLLMLAAWSVMACVILLPSMHERYAYFGEALLWVWFFVKPAFKRLWPAVTFTFIGYCACASYLFGEWPVRMEILSVVNLLLFGWFTWELLQTLQPKNPAGRVRRHAAPPAAELPAVEAGMKE